MQKKLLPTKLNHPSARLSHPVYRGSLSVAAVNGMSDVISRNPHLSPLRNYRPDEFAAQSMCADFKGTRLVQGAVEVWLHVGQAAPPSCCALMLSCGTQPWNANTALCGCLSCMPYLHLTPRVDDTCQPLKGAEGVWGKMQKSGAERG